MKKWLVIISLWIIFIEFFIPWKNRLPRETYLMGFAVTDKMVDDTPINTMGFTGDVVTGVKNPRTIRILTLGGSAMFNRQMTVRLKKAFKERSNRPVEILGAALRMHTSKSSLLKYNLLSKYKFDYILIYDGINDLWADNVDTKNYRQDYSQLNPWYSRNFLLNNSVICRIFYNKFIYKKPDREENDNSFQSIKTLEINTRLLIDKILKDGAIPVLMTMAWYIPENYSLQAFKNNKLNYNNPEGYDSHVVELWGSVQRVQKGMTDVNNTLRELSIEKNVPLIDQEILLGKNPRWFGDVIHLSNEGTDEFIQNIVNFFVKKQFINS
jgi:hypothetical protein